MNRNLKPRVSSSSKKRAKRRTLVSVFACVLAVSMSVGVLPMLLSAEEADTSPNVGLGASSSSTLQLGSSNSYSVSSSQDLLDAFASVSDEDYSGLVISIDNDFTVLDQASWTPVGTDAKPFNGTVLGNGHKISGLGSDSHPSLFGVVKGATLKDLNIVTDREYNSPNPYYGLFRIAQESNISNCLVSYQPIETTMILRSLRSGTITPDAGWAFDTSTGGASASPQIANASQLWAFAADVASGNNYAGKTVTLTGNADGLGDTFTGIGTEANPFVGQFDGGGNTISNLTIQGTNNVGLFNYIETDHGVFQGTPLSAPATAASITNLTLSNVSVSGSNNVGGFVGYGKDVHLENLGMDGGTVSGTIAVGGIVGSSVTSFQDDFSTEDIIPLSNQQSLSKSYSTASVSGTARVGGLIGYVSEYDQAGGIIYIPNAFYLVDTCFTTGTISGTTTTGGLIGEVDSITVSIPFGITNSASMATVSGNSAVGGLLGASSLSGFGTTTDDFITSSYFAGTVKGSSSSGGLAGSLTNVSSGGSISESYVSGHVTGSTFYVTNAPFGEYLLLPVVGDWGFVFTDSPVMSNNSIYVAQNTAYRTGDPTNANIPPADISAYDAFLSGYVTAANPSRVNFNAPYDYTYFAGAVAPITGFGSGSLTYDASGNVTGGTYPALTAFSSMSTKFQEFSAVSTNAGLANFPSALEVIPSGSGFSASIDGTADFVLPSGYTWTFDGASSVSFDDATLTSGQNTATISSGKIAFTDIPNAKQTVTLTAVGNGLTLNYTVIFKDTAVRPILSSVPSTLKTDTSANANVISTAENILSITYPETLIGASLPASVALQEYSDGNFSGTPTSHAGAVTLNVLGGNTLQIVIDKTKLNYDKSYRIDFAGAGITDGAGNLLDTSYYFRSQGNLAPVLSFDDTYPLYVKDSFSNNSTNASKDQQVVSMLESDSLYTNYLEGIIVDNPESAIDLSTIATTNYTFTVLSSKQGSDGYPSLGSNPLTTFSAIPGEYKIDYRIPDKEDPSLFSNTISRTYRVYGKPMLKQGNNPYSLLTVSLDSADMAAIYKDMQENSLTPAQAVEKVLVQKYLNDTSNPDHLTAFQYSYDGTSIAVPISFDTSTLTSSIFTDGYRAALPILVGGEEKVFVLNIQGNVSDYEIVVDYTTFTVSNSFNRPQVFRYINPRVKQKSTGLIVDKMITYDYSGVRADRYNVPQPVVFTIADTDGVIVNGVDTTVSTTVNLIIERHPIYHHPEDKDNVVGAFWETTKDQIRKAAPERVMNYDLSYEEAIWTPADLYRVVENRDGDVVNFTLPSGIKMSFYANKMKSSAIPYDVPNYNMSIEPMYDVYLARDTDGVASQQFYTADTFAIPGTVTVSIPLNSNMPQDELKLYYVDETTGRYVLEQEIMPSQIVDGNVVLEMTQFRGRYIMTTVDLDGKEAGDAYKEISKQASK